MSDLGRWEPETPRQVVDRFRRSDVRQPWWIAGGYAIELFAGRSLRPHGDIDVLILRRDQWMVHHVLPGWDIQAADPPGQLRPWREGELLPEHVHDIWCREGPTSPWRIQFMIDNAEGQHWHSRRHPAVTLPVDRLGRRTRDGWPYLAPEVQLHYKAKPANQLAKDEIDFAAALPLLSQPASRWLDEALGTTLPDHHWRRALKTHTAHPR
ncbi:amino acid transporter [Micromonospora sp. AMSO12t]|uniref:nucleotidyltransferase domain-containing protein n=1 Tax=Micromonospora sp. AMSO12t TaxID=2650410 RepID=UPI001788A3FF|nr:amino acid transporter [Micromonospora sp. AMSO12t]